AGAGDAEEAREQPGGVVRDDGDPVTDLDAEGVQVRRLGPSELTHPRVRHVLERGGRLVRLVDEGGALSVDHRCAVGEGVDGHGDERAGGPPGTWTAVSGPKFPLRCRATGSPAVARRSTAPGDR